MFNLVCIVNPDPADLAHIVAHPDLDGQVLGSSPGHTKFFLLTVPPQPVLVIITLSKGNSLAIKRPSSYSGHPDKGGILQKFVLC